MRSPSRRRCWRRAGSPEGGAEAGRRQEASSSCEWKRRRADVSHWGREVLARPRDKGKPWAPAVNHDQRLEERTRRYASRVSRRERRDHRQEAFLNICSGSEQSGLAVDRSLVMGQEDRDATARVVLVRHQRQFFAEPLALETSVTRLASRKRPVDCVLRQRVSNKPLLLPRASAVWTMLGVRAAFLLFCTGCSPAASVPGSFPGSVDNATLMYQSLLGRCQNSCEVGWNAHGLGFSGD